MPAVPIQIARRRAAFAKRGVVFAYLLAFAATVGLARSSHPATASASTTAKPARAVLLAFRRRDESHLGGGSGPARTGDERMIWYVARAGGIVAYLLLSLTLCIGMGLAGRARVPGFPRVAVNDLHRFAGILTGSFIAIHVGAVLLDSYVRFTVPQVLVPLAAGYRTVAVAFGIEAAELLVALAVTNRLRRVLPPRIWRGAHYLNFIVWASATIHGITAGTDNSTVWLMATYVAAIATVGGIACWRFAEPSSAGTPGTPASKPLTRTATTPLS